MFRQDGSIGRDCSCQRGRRGGGGRPQEVLLLPHVPLSGLLHVLEARQGAGDQAIPPLQEEQEGNPLRGGLKTEHIFSLFISSLFSSDHPSGLVRVPGHALHPDPPSLGGAEATGATSLDVSTRTGLSHTHVLLELPSAGRLAKKVSYAQ